MTSIPMLFDAHNDSIILRDVRDDAADFAAVDPAYDVDLPRLRAGNVGGMFVMVGDSNLAQSVRLIDAVREMPRQHPGDFALCTCAGDVRAAWRDGRVALVMSIEGQAMFSNHLAGLRLWHQLGVRVASISHGEGRFGGPPTALQYDRSCGGYLATDARNRLRRREKGLTPFAREALAEMARLRMVLDLTHANDAAFWEALECYDGPVCCTHSNCFSLCPHARNLTDDMMRALAARDGVMAFCFYAPFVDAANATPAAFADHVMHALELMGEAHVGIGTDFDGIPPQDALVFEDAAALPLLWKELSDRGLDDALLARIAADNLLALLPTTDNAQNRALVPDL